MANHTRHDGKVLGMDSTIWGYLVVLVFFGMAATGNAHLSPLIIVILILLWFATIGVWILSLVRGWQAKKEQEGQVEIQKLLTSPTPPSKLTANPKLYKQAQAELQTRKDEALKMQELHALRQQVEEEERKAGIFAPTLSPTQTQADPTVAMMAQLAQRKIEAERQKHLMKSLRTVEDAEWEADDV